MFQQIDPNTYLLSAGGVGTAVLGTVREAGYRVQATEMHKLGSLPPDGSLSLRTLLGR